MTQADELLALADMKRLAEGASPHPPGATEGQAMTDDVRELIERLRALVILDEVGSDNPLGRDAADTIERLTRELAEARNMLAVEDEYEALRDRAEKAESALSTSQALARTAAEKMREAAMRAALDEQAKLPKPLDNDLSIATVTGAFDIARNIAKRIHALPLPPAPQPTDGAALPDGEGEK